MVSADSLPQGAFKVSKTHASLGISPLHGSGSQRKRLTAWVATWDHTYLPKVLTFDFWLLGTCHLRGAPHVGGKTWDCSSVPLSGLRLAPRCLPLSPPALVCGSPRVWSWILRTQPGVASGVLLRLEPQLPTRQLSGWSCREPAPSRLEADVHPEAAVRGVCAGWGVCTGQRSSPS